MGLIAAATLAVALVPAPVPIWERLTALGIAWGLGAVLIYLLK